MEILFNINSLACFFFIYYPNHHVLVIRLFLSLKCCTYNYSKRTNINKTSIQKKNKTLRSV